MKGLANGKDNVCGFCEKVCGAGAINFNQKEEIITEKYGAIIVATGYNPIDLAKFDEFAYSQSKDVVSSLEFERLCNASGPTNGHLLRPSDGKEPKTIVFVQCVGSRCSADAGRAAPASVQPLPDSSCRGCAPSSFPPGCASPAHRRC